MKKIAFITGINGQDGSYLAELLLSRGYKIFGAINKNSNNTQNIAHLVNQIDLISYDLNSQSDAEIIKKIQPNELYHLAGASFVSYEQKDSDLIINSNAKSTEFLLDNVLNYAKNCRFFLAGSSEMFGLSNESPQNENSTFNPQNIYGLSKLKAFEILKKYRQNHKIFACCGILYNHESPRRNPIFLTRKISQAVAKISLGLENKIELGDIEACRDFGCAKDYVEAMFLMLQNAKAVDYVVSSGHLHKVKDILEIAFNYVQLDYKKYLKINANFVRPSPIIQLCGDSSKIYRELGWKPQHNIEKIIHEMIENDIVMIKSPNKIGGIDQKSSNFNNI